MAGIVGGLAGVGGAVAGAAGAAGFRDDGCAVAGGGDMFLLWVVPECVAATLPQPAAKPASRAKPAAVRFRVDIACP
jgi:hypothetical protein